MNSYLDFLEGAFLLRRLPPWLPNLKKRLVRSPRVYWRDSGLLHALLNVRGTDELLHQPWVGASWEGFVIGQVIESLAAHGVTVAPHYFRTSDGYELDLVFKLGRRLWAIEVKLTSSPAQDDFARFNAAADLIDADRRVLVAQVKETVFNGHSGIASLPDLLELLGPGNRMNDASKAVFLSMRRKMRTRRGASVKRCARPAWRSGSTRANLSAEISGTRKSANKSKIARC